MDYYIIKTENINEIENIYERINKLNENSYSYLDMNNYENKFKKRKDNFLKKATFYIKKNNKNSEINTEIKMECPVCYINIIPQNYKELLCCHYMCNECYDSWFKTCILKNKYITCPICRK